MRQQTPIDNPESSLPADPIEDTSSPSPTVEKPPQAGPIALSPELPPAKRRFSFSRRFSKKNLVIAAAVALVVIGGSSGLALYKIHQNNDKKAAAALQASLHSSNPTKTPLVATTKDLAFLRYAPDSAYQKDSSGKVKRETASDGFVNPVRKDNFTVSVELNGQDHSISLDKNVNTFGVSTNSEFYALSCTVADFGAVGGNDATFTAQFYDKSGNKTHTSTWTELGTNAPIGYGYDSGCSSDAGFSTRSDKFNFASRNYGRTAIDSLNYKVVFVSSDGKSHDIDNETDSDIDIPLGASPDQNTFMYDRVSATRVSQSCTDQTQLAYKIPDFEGSINELHMVDIATGVDTNLGSESSFSTDRHQISLSSPGYFSSDSGRYYLNEGTHSGCAGGDNRPIRIAYIDLKTKQLQTISSPSGKEYSNYCFNGNGNYAIEYGAVTPDGTNAQTPSAAVPTILDSKDSSTFQIDGVDPSFECDYTAAIPNIWLSLDKTTYRAAGSNYDQDKAVTGFKIIDPAKRSVKKVVFDSQVLIQSDPLSTGPTITANKNVGYMNREGAYSDAKQGYASPPPTVLFDLTTGKTVNVPYADIVL